MFQLIRSKGCDGTPVKGTFYEEIQKSQFKRLHLFPNRKSIKEKRRKSFSQLEKVGLLSTTVEQIRQISMTSTKK